jgi:hypothetical protein
MRQVLATTGVGLGVAVSTHVGVAVKVGVLQLKALADMAASKGWLPGPR